MIPAWMKPCSSRKSSADTPSAALHRRGRPETVEQVVGLTELLCWSHQTQHRQAVRHSARDQAAATASTPGRRVTVAMGDAGSRVAAWRTRNRRACRSSAAIAFSVRRGQRRGNNDPTAWGVRRVGNRRQHKPSAGAHAIQATSTDQLAPRPAASPSRRRGSGRMRSPTAAQASDQPDQATEPPGPSGARTAATPRRDRRDRCPPAVAAARASARGRIRRRRPGQGVVDAPQNALAPDQIHGGDRWDGDTWVLVMRHAQRALPAHALADGRSGSLDGAVHHLDHPLRQTFRLYARSCAARHSGGSLQVLGHGRPRPSARSGQFAARLLRHFASASARSAGHDHVDPRPGRTQDQSPAARRCHSRCAATASGGLFLRVLLVEPGVFQVEAGRPSGSRRRCRTARPSARARKSPDRRGTSPGARGSSATRAEGSQSSRYRMTLTAPWPFGQLLSVGEPRIMGGWGETGTARRAQVEVDLARGVETWSRGITSVIFMSMSSTTTAKGWGSHRSDEQTSRPVPRCSSMRPLRFVVNTTLPPSGLRNRMTKVVTPRPGRRGDSVVVARLFTRAICSCASVLRRSFEHQRWYRLAGAQQVLRHLAVTVHAQRLVVRALVMRQTEPALPSRMAWTASCVERSRSVSSMRRMNSPPRWRASTNSTARGTAPPMCR